MHSLYIDLNSALNFNNIVCIKELSEVTVNLYNVYVSGLKYKWKWYKWNGDMYKH